MITAVVGFFKKKWWTVWLCHFFAVDVTPINKINFENLMKKIFLRFLDNCRFKVGDFFEPHPNERKIRRWNLGIDIN